MFSPFWGVQRITVAVFGFIVNVKVPWETELLFLRQMVCLCPLFAPLSPKAPDRMRYLQAMPQSIGKPLF